MLNWEQRLGSMHVEVGSSSAEVSSSVQTVARASAQSSASTDVSSAQSDRPDTATVPFELPKSEEEEKAIALYAMQSEEASAQVAKLMGYIIRFVACYALMATSVGITGGMARCLLHIQRIHPTHDHFAHPRAG